MIDLSLIITIGVIFFLSLTAAYLRTKTRDRCLKSWEGFHVTLERTTGKLVWGELRVVSTGMEFIYTDTVQDERHLESSYLLYASEYAEIQALYRYVAQLSDKSREQRARDIDSSFHPSAGRRFRRSAQNFLGTATDSLNEVFGLVLGRAGKSGGRFIAADGTSSIKSLSGKVLGQVGTIYDPLLERHIGNRVVIEVLEGTDTHEHVGILKNYSQDFVEILDVRYPLRRAVAVETGGRFEGEGLVLEKWPGTIHLTNRNEWPVLVHSISYGDREELINAVIDGGEQIELHLSDAETSVAKLIVRIPEELDFIVPRSRCVVRHRAEAYEETDFKGMLEDIVFDVGKRFSSNGDDGRDNSEARLRQALRADPKNATAAANLGYLLLQKDQLAEAEKWLRQALRFEYSLPDGGRRARMNLREIERRRQGMDAYAQGVIQQVERAEAEHPVEEVADL
jgi:tetratricopeptide (TPR) repeat protein